MTIAFIAGSTLDRNITDDFTHIQDSFLVGSVALAGLASLMPYLYTNIKYDAHQVRWLPPHHYRTTLKPHHTRLPPHPTFCHTPYLTRSLPNLCVITATKSPHYLHINTTFPPTFPPHNHNTSTAPPNQLYYISTTQPPDSHHDMTT